MKFIPALLCLIYCFDCYSQKDTSGAPLKIFASGSLAIINGWEPYEGEFYSMKGYDDSKPKSSTFNYEYGFMAALKIHKHHYLLVGFDVLNARYDKFRLSPAADEHNGHVLIDTIYASYHKKVFSVPVGIQFPVFVKRITLAARISLSNEFTNSESYIRITTDTSNGFEYRFSQSFQSGVTRFTGLRFESALDVEFRNITGNTLFYLAVNYSSPKIINQYMEKYFLHYGSTISFRMGVGYFFGGKKKEQVEYACLTPY